jgi:hypothetical protein
LPAHDAQLLGSLRTGKLETGSADQEVWRTRRGIAAPTEFAKHCAAREWGIELDHRESAATSQAQGVWFKSPTARRRTRGLRLAGERARREEPTTGDSEVYGEDGEGWMMRG